MNLASNTSISVRKMRETDLEYVLSWRNHPDVRRFMLSQHEITRDEHRAWFDQASKDETRELLIFHDRNQPVGSVIFSGVKIKSSADWSFYSAPGSPAGTGTRLCETAIEFAFRELKINKIIGKVLEFNEASIRVHERLGFLTEEYLREHTLIDGKHHDLRIFGLIYDKWQSIKKTENNY
jgi:UDP-4-amino-4,6-dideoxy-N-acetyl-beta-L-altrosamine N-acetyltransferase